MGLTTLPLALLIIGAIDSIRNLPTTALFGSSLLFFFILSAIIFLVPTALISAELTARSTDKQGVYHWISDGLGKKTGLLAAWLQWINTMVWYPTMLSFIAGTLAYLLDPTLAAHKSFLILIISQKISSVVLTSISF